MSFCQIACLFLEVEQSHGLKVAASIAHHYATETDGLTPKPWHEGYRRHQCLLYCYTVLDTRYHATF